MWLDSKWSCQPCRALADQRCGGDKHFCNRAPGALSTQKRGAVSALCWKMWFHSRHAAPHRQALRSRVSRPWAAILGGHQQLLSLPTSSCRQKRAGLRQLPSPSPCPPRSTPVTLRSVSWTREGPDVKNRVLLCEVSLFPSTHRRASDWEFSTSHNPKITSPLILTLSSL